LSRIFGNEGWHFFGVYRMKQLSSSRQGDKVLVLSDFDGTVCSIDLGNAFLRAFAQKGWQEIDRSYSANEIGSRNAYGRVAALIRASKDEILCHVRENGRLDPYFEGFYRFCLQEGMDLKIVSDGLDVYIDAVLKMHGLGEIQYYCNYAVFFEGNKMRVDFPEAQADCSRCGTCKTSIVRKYRKDYQRIIYIGDSYSDLCAAKEADLVFAKDVLLERYQASGTACVPFVNFSDIQKHLRQVDCSQQNGQAIR